MVDGMHSLLTFLGISYLSRLKLARTDADVYGGFWRSSHIFCWKRLKITQIFRWKLSKDQAEQQGKDTPTELKTHLAHSKRMLGRIIHQFHQEVLHLVAKRKNDSPRSPNGCLDLERPSNVNQKTAYQLSQQVILHLKPKDSFLLCHITPLFILPSLHFCVESY